MLMRAVLIANHSPGLERGSPARPGCLDRLVDRSWLQHAIEQLCAGGVLSVDVLAGEGAPQIFEALRDGERWGVSIRCHRLDAGRDVHGALGHLRAEPDLLLADATAIVAATHWRSGGQARTSVTLYHHARLHGGEIKLEWTGWCRGPSRAVLDAAAHASRTDALASLLDGDAAVSSMVCQALSAHTAEQLLDANHAVLTRRAAFVSPRGKPGPDGIWRGRSVKIHPTARLVEPVYVGDHAEVGPGAVLGPNVVLGDGCIVEGGARARNCAISPATYVGASVSCERVLELGPHGYWCAGPRGSLVPCAARLVDLRGISISSVVRRFTRFVLGGLASALSGYAHAAASWLDRTVRSSGGTSCNSVPR